VSIPFADGHTRTLPRLTAGPFRYRTYAEQYLRAAQRHAHVPVLQAARYLPADQIGTCDDCGFAPFADDTSTTRDTAFAKIQARIEGTHLAAQELGI